MVQCRSLGGLDYMPDLFISSSSSNALYPVHATLPQQTRPRIKVTAGSTAYVQKVGALPFRLFAPYFGGAVPFGIVAVLWQVVVAN